MNVMKAQERLFDFYRPACKTESYVEKNFPILPTGQNETVLLVDDEDIILNVGKKLLDKMGYNVMLAESGREAIEILKKNRTGIDIVILDMIMPDMEALEAFENLRAINREVKILLSSGYALNGEAEEVLKRGCNGFMQKPFSLGAMSIKLREILDS